jgi:hypothetical protein
MEAKQALSVWGLDAKSKAFYVGHVVTVEQTIKRAPVRGDDRNRIPDTAWSISTIRSAQG